jgi:hypothetical protein
MQNDNPLKQLILSLVVLAGMILPAKAAVITVNTVTELQNALNSASQNNENDTIVVNPGNYNLTKSLDFRSNENHSLCIKGSGNPVLSGGDSLRVLNIINLGNAAEITIDGLTIEHGVADYGGGLYLETDAANINLRNCSIRHNRGDIICGGANCYSVSGNMEISHCDFRNNSAPNTSGYPNGTAGGLFAQTEDTGTQIVLTNSFFLGNFAMRDAGGAMLYPLGKGSSVIVENNIFENDTANEFGGGCWIRCPGGDANVQYHNNVLSKNSAAIAGSGGGSYIEIESGTINATHNIHVGNFAVWQGGGMWISHNGGDITLENNVFSENKALETGGGINVFLESGNLVFKRNTADNNKAETGGGANFAVTSASIDIHNNTFYSNTANSEGGDTYFYFDYVTASSLFYNNILFGSTVPALSFSGNSGIVATYSDIENGNGEAWFGTGCIDTNPMFENVANSNFHLKWDDFPVSDSTKSPCIDTGDPASTADADATVADMGAFFFDQTNTSVYTNSSKGKGVNIFPNPSSDFIEIISENDFQKITWYNSSGQKLFCKKLTSKTNHYKFDVQPLKRGVYLLVVHTNLPISKKVFITR